MSFLPFLSGTISGDRYSRWIIFLWTLRNSSGQTRDDVEMFGTIAGLSLTKGAELKALVIQPDFSWKMAPLTSEMYVPAFECYLVVKGDMASSIADGGSIPSSFGDATGIWGIETDGLDDGDWYNLDGSKLEGKPKAKGLYIHNGRKVVVK